MKYISFVFDDGPCELMYQMVDKIKGFGWHAGFAVMGRKINDNTLPVLKYAVDNGFQIVSHGQEHVHVEKLPSKEDMKEELIRPIMTIKEKLGYDVTMARLPFLSASPEVLSLAKELKLPLLGHGIDGGNDWNPQTPSNEIVNAVLSSVTDGAVCCLHALEHTNKALDIILPQLKKMGFCLLTPEELFVKKGIAPPLGVQINNTNDFLT